MAEAYAGSEDAVDEDVLYEGFVSDDDAIGVS